jgi:hypothetical protein
MLKNFSPNHARRALLSVIMPFTLVLLLAITASAYTLVFRDGRREEIPAEFTVTRTTLTYEIAPGFLKTMQLILIDVTATERANNEAPGSFFKHKEETAVADDFASPAVRTLTNRDLAAVRQRRIESEQAYENRRKELGLPTVEETRRRQAEDGAVVREQIRAENMAKAREESYWRERARNLRAEIATVDTQISYLRGRISEFNENSLSNLVITEVYPLWPRPRLGFPRVARPIPGLGYPYPNSYPYPYPNSYPYPYPYPNQYPSQYPAGPFDNFDNSAERANLTNHLDDLQVRRAGLAAQWRLLEDEARDARVPQIWLEP